MDQNTGENVENTNVEAGNENATVEAPPVEPGTTDKTIEAPTETIETPVDTHSNETGQNQPDLETISTEEVENLDDVIPPTEEPTEPELTADEKIIDAWLQNGKTQVSMNELIQAGFEAENIDSYNFIVGRFTLNRILLVSPYNIERTEKSN